MVASHLGVAAKIAVHVMALAMVATVTVLVVSESQSILEENLGAEPQNMMRSALTGAGTGISEAEADDDDLFDQLVTPEYPAPAQDVTIPTTETIASALLTAVPPAGSICVKRAAPKCKTVPVKCVKEGPQCTYEKKCITRNGTCTKAGICVTPSKKCRKAFSKGCVSCARQTPSCLHAHKVATTCVAKCRKGCDKVAVCEQKCAQGCLSTYKGFIEKCKRTCPPCQSGAKKTCWDTCKKWKHCGKAVDKCKTVHDCVKKGKKCERKPHCAKWGKKCKTVKKCAQKKRQCKKSTRCIRRDTKCTHEVSGACKKCHNKSTACKGEMKVKAKCSGDCDAKCGKKGKADHQPCLAACRKGCAASKAALGRMCKVQCPTCEKRSNACHLRCLKQETKTSCKKVCAKHAKVKKCKKFCKHKETSLECKSVCKKSHPRKACSKSCQKWNFSSQRPCEYGCKSWGRKYVCHKGKPKCVRWSGGKVCEKLGACLHYEVPDTAYASEPVESHSNAPHHSHKDDEGSNVATYASGSARSVVLAPGPVILPSSKTKDKKLSSKTKDKKLSSKTKDKKLSSKTKDKKLSSKTKDKKLSLKTKDEKTVPKTKDEKTEMKTKDEKTEMKTKDEKTEMRLAAKQTMPPVVKIQGPLAGDARVPDVPPLSPNSKLGQTLQKATADVERLLGDQDSSRKHEEDEQTQFTAGGEPEQGEQLTGSNVEAIPPESRVKEALSMGHTTPEVYGDELAAAIAAAQEAKASWAESQAALVSAQPSVQPTSTFDQAPQQIEMGVLMGPPPIMVQDSPPAAVQDRMMPAEPLATPGFAMPSTLQEGYSGNNIRAKKEILGEPIAMIQEPVHPALGNVLQAEEYTTSDHSAVVKAQAAAAAAAAEWRAAQLEEDALKQEMAESGLYLGRP